MNGFVQRLQVFLINNRTPLTIILGLIVMVFIGLFLSSMKKDFKSAKKNIEKKAKSSTTKAWLRNIYFFTVEKLKKVPIMGDAIRNMSYTFQCQWAISDEDAMMMVGKSLTLFIAGATAGAIVAMVYFEDVIISVIVAIMFGKIAFKFTKMKPIKFLEAMQDAIDDFLHAYHEHNGNMDQAFYAIINSSSIVAGHFNIMYDYIKKADISHNPDEVQKEYYRITPSKVLRNFYSVVYMTYKFGDTMIDGKSAFSTNVYQIQDSISSDIYELESLADGTFGESAFIIVSIFMLPLTEWYMVNYFNFEGFEYVQKFMSSVIGYMISILCAGVAFICFLMYERFTDLNTMETRKIVSWETKLLHNLTFRRIVNFVSPPERRASMQDKMLRCGSTDTVAAMTCKRILVTGAVFLLCVVSVLFNIEHSTNKFLNDPFQGLTQETYREQVVLYYNGEESDFLDKNVQIDKAIIGYLNKNYPTFLLDDVEIQDEKFNEAVKSFDFDDNKTELGQIYTCNNQQDSVKTRILSKMTMIQETKGMYNVLFVVAATLAAFFVPLLMIYVQSVLNAQSMLQTETHDLQRMTLMLIQHSTCTPEQLLSWYTNSTMLFARQFHEASITRDLKGMAAKIGYKPFTQLMACLHLALVQHMDLTEAFSGIEQKMRIQEKEEQRKIQKLTKFRVKTVNTLTTICLGCVMGLYMMVPMAIAMLQMFTSMGFEM